MIRGWCVGVFLMMLCGGAEASCGSAAARVMVIPSLHKMLDGNPHYGYRRLDDIVAGFHPDFIGVEIRKEDMGRSDAYLSRTYPREMVELSEHYRGRAFGFDWLGHELEGIAVPADWWTKHSRIKQLERDWAAFTPVGDEMTQLGHQLEAVSARRDAIAGSATVEMLANGPYDEVTARYYQILFQLTRATPYALLPQWYAERDRQLAGNVLAAVRAHAGCRIAVVTGADHHGPIMHVIRTSRLDVDLVPVP